MNTAIHFNPRVIKTTLFPNWKQLNKTTRWMLLGNWNQEDEAVYGEMVEADPTFKPTQQLSSKSKEGKAVSDRRKQDRKNAKSQPRDFASFGGKKPHRKHVDILDPELEDLAVN